MFSWPGFRVFPGIFMPFSKAGNPSNIVKHKPQLPHPNRCKSLKATRSNTFDPWKCLLFLLEQHSRTRDLFTGTLTRDFWAWRKWMSTQPSEIFHKSLTDQKLKIIQIMGWNIFFLELWVWTEYNLSKIVPWHFHCDKLAMSFCGFPEITNYKDKRENCQSTPRDEDKTPWSSCVKRGLLPFRGKCLASHPLPHQPSTRNLAHHLGRGLKRNFKTKSQFRSTSFWGGACGKGGGGGDRTTATAGWISALSPLSHSPLSHCHH